MSWPSAIKNPDARKIFGKRELAIIEKQLWGVGLTQSEQNRLSRDIRKKLRFIETLQLEKDGFELKKGMEVQRRIDDALAVIKESKWHSQIERVILFGSTVENKRSLRSDIDLCVQFNSIRPKEAFEFRKQIMGRVPERIEVQVLSELQDKIRKEINQKGKIIYERANP